QSAEDVAGTAAGGLAEKVAQVEVGTAETPGAEPAGAGPPGGEPSAAARAESAAGAARAEAARVEDAACFVVLLALVRVPEDRVRLADPLEALLGLGVVGVGVRVQLAGELAVRLLDLVSTGGGRDAQIGVEISLH